MTRVSILIPAYNAERWIADTIGSALAQTWPCTELIVVDDGSRDGTLAVARTFQSRSVQVVTQPNMGAAAARNRALELAQGTYIQWLDADDLLSPDKVANQMRKAEECGDPRVLHSSAWAYFMHRPSAAHFAPNALWQDLTPIEWMRRKWHGNLHMQTATWLVSRDLSDAAGPWNPEMLVDDDGEYFTRVVLASNGVRFTEDSRVFYRIVGTNRVSYIGGSRDKLEAQLKGMCLQIGYVRACDDSPATRAAIVRYLDTWLPLFYPERPDLVDAMRAMAADVGATLATPPVHWKYWLIDALFGRIAAKRAQRCYNDRKTLVLRSWSRLLSGVGGE
jgi:glycosyltransferase involved in cell wall biosynthesis